MTMLYGERRKSFLRLQEEILKALEDRSIFVWKGLQPGQPGLLASSPDAFASSGDVQTIRDRQGGRPWALSNRGLYGRIPLFRHSPDTYVTLLPCTRQGKSDRIGIFLRRLFEDDQSMRVAVRGQELMEDTIGWTTQLENSQVISWHDVSIRQRPLIHEEIQYAYRERIAGFQLDGSILSEDATSAPLFRVSDEWDPGNRIASFSGPGGIKQFANIDIGQQDQGIEVVRFGLDAAYNPVVYLTQRDVLYKEISTFWGLEQIFKGLSDPPHVSTFRNGTPGPKSAFSESGTRPDGRQFARMTASCGLWAFTADRITGKDVYIVNSNWGSDEQNVTPIARVRL